ncbi:MAG TPA: 2-C-methyl-D-erythritol 4-phosphate cytidylyltransferase [Tidjanibacter sp.]|nr:2-C-methyl-D-erythritol 4-phosphate cytidylyltransferase [Tidjanibacter sp.]
MRLHLYAAPRNGGTGGRSLPKQKKEERDMTNISVIIVAGGSGTRMGAAVPKQFLPLEEEETILEATLRRFLAALPDSEIVVVLPAAETERWREICRQRGISETHRLCSGGATRFESVRNGIAALGPCDYIAVHDGVRPLVTERLIHTCVATAERYGTAVPAIRPADSFRKVDATTGKSRPVDRETLRAVQTPQVFRADLLRRAYKADYRPEFTDDASVVEANGEQVTLCEGERTNIKITSPADLLIARILRHAGDGKETDSL